jgi:multimeric flavodoxin WrbA
VYTDRKIVFLADLDPLGHCDALHTQLLMLWQQHGELGLQGSEGLVLIHSSGNLSTKRAAQGVLFWANRMGCRFPGHAMVESLGDLSNFLTWQKTIPLSLEEIRDQQCRKQMARFMAYERPRVSDPRILVLHASSNRTSNTLMLWDGVARHLPEGWVNTMHFENGSVVDCKGCDFKTCIHYAQQKSCFYGGIIISDLIPAIEAANVIVFITPNYNDALPAMHTALINRLTALYRRMPLYDKRFYSIIVSGNSGSDSVACQMIGALNLNKGLDLPPRFALMKTANDPGSILKDPEFDRYTAEFAASMKAELCQ